MKLTKIQKMSNLSFRVDLDRKGDSKQMFLLLSDLHIDNPKCDRKLLTKVLNQALEKNALILIFGDLFCLMQGKGDPRRNKADIRPEHNKPNYIDAVVKDTASILKPYAKNILLIADGNHETSIIKHIEVDPIDYLLNYLHKYNPSIQHGGYQGFVRFVANARVKRVQSNYSTITVLSVERFQKGFYPLTDTHPLLSRMWWFLDIRTILGWLNIHFMKWTKIVSCIKRYNITLRPARSSKSISNQMVSK